MDTLNIFNAVIMLILVIVSYRAGFRDGKEKHREEIAEENYWDENGR